MFYKVLKTGPEFKKKHDELQRYRKDIYSVINYSMRTSVIQTVLDKV